MTSNNETVSQQNLCEGKIAKSIRSEECCCNVVTARLNEFPALKLPAV